MRVLIKHADLVNTLHDIYAREVETSWPKGKPSASRRPKSQARRAAW